MAAWPVVLCALGDETTTRRIVEALGGHVHIEWAADDARALAIVRVDGGPGNDKLGGGPGDDQINGGPDTDVCGGGPGVEVFSNCETVNP